MGSATRSRARLHRHAGESRHPGGLVGLDPGFRRDDGGATRKFLGNASRSLRSEALSPAPVPSQRLRQQGQRAIVAVRDARMVVVELLVDDAHAESLGLGREDAGAVMQGELVAASAVDEDAA